MPQQKPDYGIDAPGVLRGFLLWGAACLLAGVSLRGHNRGVLHMGHVDFTLYPMFLGTGIVLLVEAVLFWIYVRYGKFRHRDRLLAYHQWRGDERVLDVGCGRGLLLAGAAKRLTTGHATGIDVWSNVDMGGNSAAATQRNLQLEGISEKCDLVSVPAQDMPFDDNSFDVIVSNLCLHNIYDKPTRRTAVEQIARVLKPGGQAILSDYKLTGEYETILREMGLNVTRRWGSPLTTFPPLRSVIAVKPVRRSAQIEKQAR